MHDHHRCAKRAMLAGQALRQVGLAGPLGAILAQLQHDDDPNHRARVEALRDHFAYLAESFPTDPANNEWHREVMTALLVARRELHTIDLDARLVQLDHFRKLIDGLSIANRLDAIEAATIAPDHEGGREAFHNMRRLADGRNECSTLGELAGCKTLSDRDESDRRTASAGS